MILKYHTYIPKWSYLNNCISFDEGVCYCQMQLKRNVILCNVFVINLEIVIVTTIKTNGCLWKMISQMEERRRDFHWAWTARQICNN